MIKDQCIYKVPFVQGLELQKSVSTTILNKVKAETNEDLIIKQDSKGMEIANESEIEQSMYKYKAKVKNIKVEASYSQVHVA